MLAALALQGLAIRAIQGLLGASLPVKFQYSSPFADATRKRLARAKGTQKLDEISPYEQLVELRGIQWPAPTYEIAQNGGTKRRFMPQEGWKNKPYGYFRTKDGKVHMKLVHQDYSGREKLTKELMRFGAEKGLPVRSRARWNGKTGSGPASTRMPAPDARCAWKPVSPSPSRSTFQPLFRILRVKIKTNGLIPKLTMILHLTRHRDNLSIRHR